MWSGSSLGRLILNSIIKRDFVPICPFKIRLVCFDRDRVSLCSSGSPGNLYAYQVGLELSETILPVSWLLGLNACATMPGFHFSFFNWKRIFYMYRLFACACVCAPFAYLVPWETKKDNRSARTGVTDSLSLYVGVEN